MPRFVPILSWRPVHIDLSNSNFLLSIVADIQLDNGGLRRIYRFVFREDPSVKFTVVVTSGVGDPSIPRPGELVMFTAYKKVYDSGSDALILSIVRSGKLKTRRKILPTFVRPLIVEDGVQHQLIATDIIGYWYTGRHHVYIAARRGDWPEVVKSK